MRRNMILKGDKTTRGGVVIEGDESFTSDGRPVACQGARIDCPSCESEGRIVNVGPYLPMTLRAGKQVALEGDHCVCKCDPPPLLIASRDNMSMTMQAREVARTDYSPNGRWLAKKTEISDEVFDRYFQFVDERGEPVSQIRVHLIDVDSQTKQVKTDSDGRTPVVSGREGQRIGVSLTAGARQ